MVNVTRPLAIPSSVVARLALYLAAAIAMLALSDNLALRSVAFGTFGIFAVALVRALRRRRSTVDVAVPVDGTQTSLA